MCNRMAGFVLAFFLAVSLTAAPTASELLQKGIYTQETVGDLDAAIRIYQQVVALGAEARAQAAQAQYRLGLCLLRKGSPAEASKAFDKLIADYPEQKELVAAARQQNPSGLKLIAPPWTEGEMLCLKLKLPTGMAIGVYAQSIERSSGGELVVTTRTQAPGVNQFSRSHAELDTMRPKASYYRHDMLGEYKLAYDGKQAKVESNGKDTKPVELNHEVIDNEAAVPTMRRLPLAEGYKTQFHVMSPLGMLFPITVEVTAIEELATPAGKFRTFKLELSPIRQTFWISADAHRYLVRMDVNGAIGELEKIARIDAEPTVLRDETRKASVTLPSGWLQLTADVPGGSYFNAGLFDPESVSNSAVWVGKIDRDARSEMTAKVEERPKTLKNYKVRPDSWTPRQVNGVEAISVTADFEARNKAMVEYVTILKQGETGMVLFTRVPATELATFRPKFERIIESARLQ